MEYLAGTPGENIPQLNMRVSCKHRGIQKRYEGMAGDGGVLLGELSRDDVGLARVTVGRAANGLQKGIGDTQKRRGHHDASFIGRLSQQRADVGDRGGAGKRGAAELVDGDRMMGGRHGARANIRPSGRLSKGLRETNCN